MDINKELEAFNKFRVTKLNTFGLHLSDFENTGHYLGFLTWLSAKEQALKQCSCGKDTSAISESQIK